MPDFVTECSLRLTYFIYNVQIALKSPFIPSQHTAFHHLRLSGKLIIEITCSSSSVYSDFTTLKCKCQHLFDFISNNLLDPTKKLPITKSRESMFFLRVLNYASFSFARAASVAKPSLSFTASSASIFLLISTFASFNPCINLL